jgi:phosphomannomutase
VFELVKRPPILVNSKQQTRRKAKKVKKVSEPLLCFKAYDVRGRVPEELNDDVAYRIGCAYADYIRPVNVVVGFDIRLTSQEICAALSRGLTDMGVNVINIGQCGTEEVYFATPFLNADGGIMVTASHNPVNYNGMKFVREQSRPISGDTGLSEIRNLAEKNNFTMAKKQGAISFAETHPDYVKKLLSYIDFSNLPPLKIVTNAGNGGAGLTVDALEQSLPFEFTKLSHYPDGNFPNGVPNPLLIENREVTINAVLQAKADIGIAWDGDFDRCFFFDENGRFIEGYYIVGLLAEAFLESEAGGRIVHDPRLTWNTQRVASEMGGDAIQSKTGHSYIKEKMREEGAIYGGEMSAHHYFRDFFYCDSGMIPWLLVVALMVKKDKPLSTLVDQAIEAFPASGEINCNVADAERLKNELMAIYADDAQSIDLTDGLSIEFKEWRFNVRASNTEAVVRLNLETRADSALLKEKTEEILGHIRKG